MLVSNLGQTASDVQLDALLQDHRVQFTTGDNTGGYNLDTIELNVAEHNFAQVTVSLHSDSSGNPGSSIFTFENPDPITGPAVNIFTAPANTTLMGSRPYHIVVSATDGGSVAAEFRLTRASSNAEDDEGADDWAIANNGYYLSSGGNWTSSAFSMQIRVNGTAVGGTPPPKPTLSVDDAAASEGEDVEFTVTLSEVATELVTARWTASIESGDTATTGHLGSTTTGLVTIGLGEITHMFTVPTAEDTTDEENETFTVTLSGVSSNAQLATDLTAKGMITDDDPLPSLSVADVSVGEIGYMTFPVTLSPPSGKTVTVTWTASAESDDTATSPADFTADSQTLTFNPGDLSVHVTVRTVEDSIDEENETFTVTLSSASNAEI